MEASERDSVRVPLVLRLDAEQPRNIGHALVNIDGSASWELDDPAVLAQLSVAQILDISSQTSHAVAAALQEAGERERAAALGKRPELQKLVVYGASDDLFELEGAVNYEATGYRRRCRVLLTSPDRRQLVVWGEYAGRGAWHLGVELHRPNDEPWPDWPMHWGERPDRTDDPALVLYVPAGTTAEELDDDGDS
jgi:hypothetical protein